MRRTFPRKSRMTALLIASLLAWMPQLYAQTIFSQDYEGGVTPDWTSADWTEYCKTVGRDHPKGVDKVI